MILNDLVDDGASEKEITKALENANKEAIEISNENEKTESEKE